MEQKVVQILDCIGPFGTRSLLLRLEIKIEIIYAHSSIKITLSIYYYCSTEKVFSLLAKIYTKLLSEYWSIYFDNGIIIFSYYFIFSTELISPPIYSRVTYCIIFNNTTRHSYIISLNWSMHLSLRLNFKKHIPAQILTRTASSLVRWS